MISSLTKLVLLSAATSLLSQSAAAEAVIFPYNCDSTEPICHTDCVTAVHNICAGLVGSLGATQVTTVRTCTAKYIPYQGASDSKATCFAQFQRILDGSNAAALKCDGKTPGRAGGVLAMDANNQFVKGTSYAIFPVVNNPNCVVNPSKIKDPVPPRYKLFGTNYDCSAAKQQAQLRISGQISRREPKPASSPADLTTRNAQAAKCGGSIAGAVVCSAGCVVGVLATISTFGLAGSATVVGCVLCAGGEGYLVATQCKHKGNRRSLMLGGPIHERATAQAYCSGSELNSLSFGKRAEQLIARDPSGLRATCSQEYLSGHCVKVLVVLHGYR